MTDDKPMTFEEALDALAWIAFPSTEARGVRLAFPVVATVRAAHQREVEATRREELEACLIAVRNVGGMAGDWSEAFEDAILARGKPEVARPPMPRSSKYKCLRCGEWFPLDELEAHQTCGGTLAPEEKP